MGGRGGRGGGGGGGGGDGGRGGTPKTQSSCLNPKSLKPKKKHLGYKINLQRDVMLSAYLPNIHFAKGGSCLSGAWRRNLDPAPEKVPLAVEVIWKVPTKLTYFTKKCNRKERKKDNGMNTTT